MPFLPYFRFVGDETFRPVLKAFYHRLGAAGEKPIVALTAVIRKLAILMNHILDESFLPLLNNTITPRRFHFYRHNPAQCAGLISSVAPRQIFVSFACFVVEKIYPHAVQLF